MGHQLRSLWYHGLIFTTISEQGLSVLLGYGRLILVLVGTMAAVALIINPIIVFLFIRKNPYKLVFTCLKESFITAFFTRSSAANIPVNMGLCERLGLDEDTYSISIPLGATVNMAAQPSLFLRWRWQRRILWILKYPSPAL